MSFPSKSPVSASHLPTPAAGTAHTLDDARFAQNLLQTFDLPIAHVQSAGDVLSAGTERHPYLVENGTFRFGKLPSCISDISDTITDITDVISDARVGNDVNSEVHSIRPMALLKDWLQSISQQQC